MNQDTEPHPEHPGGSSRPKSFFSTYGRRVGAMHDVFPTRREGRKIATWRYVPAQRQAQVIEVDVSLVAADGLSFIAQCKQLPQPIQDSDIERLRAAVEQALDRQSSLLSGIVWEDWLEIITDGHAQDRPDHHQGIGANLHIQVNPIKRGVDPRTGEILTVSEQGYVMAFPQATRLNRTTVHDGEWKISDSTPERSYVPDTPQVRAAIEDIFTRMRDLRDALANALSSENVLHTIERNALPRIGA